VVYTDHFLMILLTYEQTSLDNFKSGRLHTLLTSAFSHRDANHLLNNMTGLYFFGSSVRPPVLLLCC
jgi:membrane associated rhomboid family serine protease